MAYRYSTYNNPLGRPLSSVQSPLLSAYQIQGNYLERHHQIGIQDMSLLNS